MWAGGGEDRGISKYYELVCNKTTQLNIFDWNLFCLPKYIYNIKLDAHIEMANKYLCWCKPYISVMLRFAFVFIFCDKWCSQWRDPVINKYLPNCWYVLDCMLTWTLNNLLVTIKWNGKCLKMSNWEGRVIWKYIHWYIQTNTNVFTSRSHKL